MINKKPFDSKTTENKNWYVLCVTPNREKKIADILMGKGIEVYCPVLKKMKYQVAGETTVSVPLFKSYLFVNISKRNRVLVFNAPGVTRYLFHQGRPAQIRNSEIEAIKNWMNDDSIEEIFVSKYSENVKNSIQTSLLQNRKMVIGENNPKIVLRDMDSVLHAKMKVKLRQRKLQVHHLN